MIDSVSADHAGNYTCMTGNWAGKVEYSTILIVDGLSNFKNESYCSHSSLCIIFIISPYPIKNCVILESRSFSFRLFAKQSYYLKL